MLARAAAFLLLSTSLASAQASQTVILDRLPAAVAGGYVGPGDINTYTTYYGVRAYSAATTGQKLLNVCATDFAHCADFVSDGSGNLVFQTVNGNNCGTSGTCVVQVAYNIAGGNNCTAASCDVSEGTFANAPTLTPNCQGGRACLTCNGSQSLDSTNALSSLSQPWSISTVSRRTSGTTLAAILIPATSGAHYYAAAANEIEMFAGAAITPAATDNQWHRFQSVFNGASGQYDLDASTVTSQNAGSTAASGSMKLCGENNGSIIPLTGNFAEGGIAAVDISANFSTLDTNYKTYYGL